MLDALIDGLFLVLQWKAFSLMMVGMGVGFFVGLLPGIGGAATLALMLPFVFKMTPVEAFAFLLGMHSVAATTGDITSILFGVPGEGLSAATVVDGHPMAKRGEAGRALGAALMSSLVGAIIGAVVLAISVPIVRPLVLTFGSPELFMVSMAGIACITSLSGLGLRSQIRGFAMGLLGLLLSTVGQERQSGTLRFDMGLFSMVWTLVIANIITVLLCLAVLNHLARLTHIRGGLIIPFVLLLIFVGSYTANRQIADLLVTFCFGVAGYFMIRFGWPRAPLVLGFVLGKLAETYLFISVSRYGLEWLGRPVVILLILLTGLIIAWPFIQERRRGVMRAADAL